MEAEKGWMQSIGYCNQSDYSQNDVFFVEKLAPNKYFLFWENNGGNFRISKNENNFEYFMWKTTGDLESS